MPTWKSLSPGAPPHLEPVPAGRLPESEVAWMTLARIRFSPCARDQLVGRVARQPAVGGERRDGVIDGAVDLVSVSLRAQLLAQIEHLRDVFRGMGIVRGRADVDLADVVQERCGVVVRDFAGRLVLQPRGD